MSWGVENKWIVILEVIIMVCMWENIIEIEDEAEISVLSKHCRFKFVN